MVLLIVLLIVVFVAIGYGFIKAINALFKRKENPYIKAHRIKMSNDILYKEYLRWLHMQGGDMPFEKWKTEEEEKFDNYFRNASSE